VILLVDPAQLYSVGFQLSFLTAWALIAVVPRLLRLVRQRLRRRWLSWLMVPLVVTVVAQIASAPVLAFYFQQLPLISPLANLVVVPLVSLAVVGSIGLLVIDLVIPIFSPWVGPLLEQLMRLILLAVEGFGGDHVPLLTTGQPSPVLTVVLYVLLVMIVLAVSRPRLRRWTVIAIMTTIIAVVGVSQLKTGQNDVVREYFVFRNSGGTAVLKTEPGSPSADLIILGARAQRYPLEERILAPALTAVGADRLGWLIVCDADYAALDDLLRLATSCEADSVGLAEHLYRACLDQNRLVESPTDVGRLIQLGDAGVVSDDSVKLVAEGLVIVDPPLVIKHAHRPAAQSTGTVSDSLFRVTIVSVPAGLSLSEASDWLDDGVNLIVCAKVEQPVSPDIPVSGAGERLWDLRRDGTVRIQIRADSTRVVEFGHLD